MSAEVTRTDAGRRRAPWGPGFDTWQSLFAFAYRGFATGLCVAVFALPLSAALIGIAHPLSAMPFLLLCALPLGPALSAAFHGFDAARRSGAATPFAHFWRGLRATAWRGLGIWALTLALLLFLYVDVVAVSGTPFAVLLGPLFAVLAIIVLATAPVALTVVSLPAGHGILAATKAGLYTAIRRPLLSLLTLAVLAAWILIILAQPVIGALALGGFALSLIWMNASGQLAAIGVGVGSDVSTGV
ncbi:DUF624 domain-containing protein [Microbacterium sp. MYb62]|uniref:DUF624 domain-containing protein n=1 Tax=Microbacterium sp. MYb62 TaxID=1848690 RepID=UPI000CFD9719|nr:DUF624 domain-containing protein [Microbacterium sp. MYb62]PRB13059.1 hypothetical protein CQ042_14115 [Microbacterium sp. MYb62]